jgi:maleylacetoacetate isomerase
MGLKSLSWETIPINLLTGEHKTSDYRAHNPSGLVPTLVLDDGTELQQSLAILDWLDAAYPDPPLLPSKPLSRARVLAAAYAIACDTQPLSNLGTVSRLKTEHGVDTEGGIAWMCHFMQVNLQAFQQLIADEGPFSFGDKPGLADICLVPQLYNAHRWGVDLSSLDRLTQIEANCLALPAFDAARPENQPDAT